MDVEQEYKILENTLQRFNIKLTRLTEWRGSDYEYVLHDKPGDIVIMRKKDGTFVHYENFNNVDYGFIVRCFYRIRDRRNKLNKILCTI